MVSWERFGTISKLFGNAINYGVLAGIAGLIDCENLKFHFARLRKRSLHLEEAWLPSVLQTKLL